ncbi:hypothetical protein MVEN_00577300 [Mycena venus]|uniref:Glycosyl hydrolase family 13 catalytic domain-containing protein n=1 Tax=Mycena venus TaxID=2733690 RepID=A0A8H7D7I9_9AGAR|nr:hypothetical protein MVEN_00577300 [Mycena venus]
MPPEIWIKNLSKGSAMQLVSFALQKCPTTIRPTWPATKASESTPSYHSPMMYGIEESFSGNSSWRDINKVAFFMWQTQQFFNDTSVLGTFVENHDQPRLWSLTNDASLTFNGLVTIFQYDGIPILYYGFEQDVGSDGPADPYNREALWLYTNYSSTATPTYGRITKLNKLRKYLSTSGHFLTAQSQNVAQQGSQDLAILRAGVLTVLTNVRDQCSRDMDF